MIPEVTDHDPPYILVAFNGGFHGSLFPTYGYRTDRVWVHDWAYAAQQQREWFQEAVLCRIRPGGEICFVGYDGHVERMPV